mgnify:CR=1 FL=1
MESHPQMKGSMLIFNNNLHYVNRNNSSIEKYRSVLEHVAPRGNRNYINAMHLVLQMPRNGDSHILAKEILEQIEIFSFIYENRPIRNNKGGMKLLYDFVFS